MTRFDWDKANRSVGGVKHAGRIVGSSDKPKMCIFYVLSKRKNVVKCRKPSIRDEKMDTRFCADHQGSTPNGDRGWLVDPVLDKETKRMARIKKENERKERMLVHELTMKAQRRKSRTR